LGREPPEGSPVATHQSALPARVPPRGGAPHARGATRPSPSSRCDLGVSEQTLRNRRRQDAVDPREREGLTTDERERLRQLERENRILREERDILRKAAAIFAQETMTPGGSR
jgi:hypothetical protein